MKKLLFSMVIALIVAGCATQTVKLSDAKQVPTERIFFENYQDSNLSEITVIRDSGFIGAGCGARISIDGDLAAVLHTSEKVSFKVKGGEYIIGVTLQNGGLCNFGVDMQERELKIQPGERRFYRAFIDGNGTPSIMPTTQAY